MRPPLLRKAPPATKGSASNERLRQRRRASSPRRPRLNKVPDVMSYLPKRERPAVPILPSVSARIGADPLHQIDDRAPQIAVFDIRVGTQQAKCAGDREEL
jgi:hypothetical protein